MEVEQTAEPKQPENLKDAMNDLSKNQDFGDSEGHIDAHDLADFMLDQEEQPEELEAKESNKDQPNAENETDSTAENQNEIEDEESSEDEEDSEESEENDDDEDLDLSDEDEASEENDPWSAEIELPDGQKFSKKELKEGVMRQSDYTVKTQEIADRSKTLDVRQADLEKQSLQAVQMLAFNEQDAMNRLNQYQNVNWQALAQQDPQNYQVHRASFDQAQADVKNLQQQKETFFHNLNLREEQQKSGQRAEAKKVLTATIKNWNDDTYYNLIDYGESLGMDRAGLENALDPKLFQLLDKAKRYDSAKESASRKFKKAKTKTKTIKQSKANAGLKNGKSDAIKRARKSGSVDDIGSALASIL